MARDISGSGQDLRGGTPYSSIPTGGFSVGGWVNFDSISFGGTPFSMMDSSTSQYTGCYMDVTAAGAIRAITTNANSFAGIASKTTVSTATWCHVAAYFEDDGACTAYLDGVAGTRDSSGATPTTMDRIVFGRVGRSTLGGDMNGKLQDWWIVPGSVGTDRLLAMYNGASPLVVMGSELIRYWPMKEVSSSATAIEVFGDTALTATGSPAVNEGPLCSFGLMYPVTRAAAAPPAGGANIEVIGHYYRNLLAGGRNIGAS